MSNGLNLYGQRFYRLYVYAQAPSKNKRSQWRCECDCGNKLIVDGTSLNTGNTKSCGCWNRDSAAARAKKQSFKHGHSGDHRKSKPASGTYRSWTAMRSRCNNPKTPQYEDYGGRGISVCSRWNKFENFLTDMGERPSGKTLDRWPDKNGNYEPGNCRWSNPQEQVDNRRLYQSLEKFSDAEIAVEFYKRQKKLNRGAVLETVPVIRLFEQ